MNFQHPSVWFLLLLVLLPLLWWRWARVGRRRGLPFSSVDALAAAGSSWVLRVRWIVPALRTAALALLVVCLARPRKADSHHRIFTEGIAIQLVVDRSGSMLAQDFEVSGRRASRLEAVKGVVKDFVEGGRDLPGRPDDLIGLITFATWADSVCPLTFDHHHLVEALDRTRVSEDERDRATAIGDAVALGVERIRALEQRSRRRGAGRITSRVMILLTDGENNEGDIAPETAAEMAQAFDIRIYTIGAGSESGFAPVPVTDPISGRQVLTRVPVSIDEKTLRQMAAATGGAYFRATDSASLERIYARIDALERTKIEQRHYTDEQELSVSAVRLGPVRMPPLLAVVLVLLAAELVLASTRFRRLP